jgi:hypothetical protein
MSKSKRKASYGSNVGDYRFFTSSQFIEKKCDVADYTNECLIIGTGGNANIKIASNFSCSADNFVVKVKPPNVSKYLYYYLLYNIEVLQNGFKGQGIEHLNKEYLTDIIIPVPSVEQQQAIVAYCEENDRLVSALETKISNIKKEARNYLNMMLNPPPDVAPIDKPVDKPADKPDDTPTDKPADAQVEVPKEPAIGLSGDKILCDFCKIGFSPKKYESHVNTIGHKKKVASAEKLKKK